MIRFVALFLGLITISGCKKTDPTVDYQKPVPVTNTSDRSWIQGWLTVEENRTSKSSNRIGLPFILSKAEDSLSQNKTPVLIMSGGPGNSSLHMANGVVNTHWGKKRNILVLEQRGTPYSQPSLDCPEIDSLRITGVKNGLWGRSLDSLKKIGLRSCFTRLKSEMIDLNGYNSLESVEDIEALRQALDIESMILYGMSYSCKLMMAYAQTYPEHTEAIILDSPLPHQVNYDEEAYRNIDSTLRRIITHYTGSKRLYNDWRDYMKSINDSVFHTSVDSISFVYTRNELIDIIMFKMSSHHSLKEIPSAVQNIITGNHEGISEVLNYYLQPGGQALGMRYSLWIQEELTDENEEAIERQKREYRWLDMYPVNDVSFETAEIWQVNSLYSNRKWPDSPYTGPALVLSGQFDPWTPEWYGVIASENLPNAQHVIYPEHSHLPGFTRQGFEDIDRFIGKLDSGESE